jgi:hypothetical protein
MVTKKDALTPFRRTWFRAGHAHAGVMLVMALVFFDYLARTSLSFAVKQVACGTLVVGILAQSGGFFIHMSKGHPDERSVGTTVTSIGAVLLTTAIAILVYGLSFVSRLERGARPRDTS